MASLVLLMSWCCLLLFAYRCVALSHIHRIGQAVPAAWFSLVRNHGVEQRNLAHKGV